MNVLKIEEIQKRNQLLVQKINRRRLVEQKCKEWTEAKQKERIQIKKLREIEKKNEESKKLQELLEHVSYSFYSSFLTYRFKMLTSDLVNTVFEQEYILLLQLIIILVILD